MAAVSRRSIPRMGTSTGSTGVSPAGDCLNVVPFTLLYSAAASRRDAVTGSRSASGSSTLSSGVLFFCASTRFRASERACFAKVFTSSDEAPSLIFASVAFRASSCASRSRSSGSGPMRYPVPVRTPTREPNRTGSPGLSRIVFASAKMVSSASSGDFGSVSSAGLPRGSAGSGTCSGERNTASA